MIEIRTASRPPIAEGLARLGINRVSLGVQDLDPTVQAAIGRVQPKVIVEAAFTALREAGIGNINTDLIYGLPTQTVPSLATTARHVADLGPDRIACYGYAHLTIAIPIRTAGTVGDADWTAKWPVITVTRIMTAPTERSTPAARITSVWAMPTRWRCRVLRGAAPQRAARRS